jgi:hypothetical protein
MRRHAHRSKSDELVSRVQTNAKGNDDCEEQDFAETIPKEKLKSRLRQIQCQEG